VEFLTKKKKSHAATIRIEQAEKKEFIARAVYFRFNSSEIEFTDIPYLHELVEYLRKNESLKLSLEGYSDGIGSYRSNLNISRKRAEKVKEYIVRAGIKEDRITAKGSGYIQEKATDTAQYNRRVDCIIINQ